MALLGSTICNSRVDFIDTRETRCRAFSCGSLSGSRKLHRLPLRLTGRYAGLLAGASSRHYQHLYSPVGTTSRVSKSISSLACQVKSEDKEESLTGESILMDEQTLLQDLQTAVEKENYAEAAKIRDSLRHLHEDSKAAILGANARFYNAFRQGDLTAMQGLWSRADNVCCVHPGASGVLGYEDVMESWEVVWMNYDFPLEIKLKNAVVHFRGDMGYVSCVEFVKTKGSSWGAQYVTNVFEKIDGQWLICIHHASLVDL